jgi:hypothetical protein|tara:strand:- start:257 stop:475 length:219 start_codon:yes stop_codon:yes gene_type:complete
MKDKGMENLQVVAISYVIHRLDDIRDSDDVFSDLEVFRGELMYNMGVNAYNEAKRIEKAMKAHLVEGNDYEQ